MRNFVMVLSAATLLLGCTPRARQMTAGSFIAVGGLGAISAADIADSDPACFSCSGDPESGMVVLAASAVLAAIGVGILAIEVMQEPDEQE